MNYPIACPFCEGTLLQETDPTTIQLEDEAWTIYHWQCLECTETFDRVEILEESGFEEELLFQEGEIEN